MNAMRIWAAALLLSAPVLASGPAEAMSDLQICGYSAQPGPATEAPRITQLDLSTKEPGDQTHGVLCTPVTLDPVAAESPSAEVPPDLYGFIIKQNLAQVMADGGKTSVTDREQFQGNGSRSVRPTITAMGATIEPEPVLEAYLALLASGMGTFFLGRRFATA